MRSAQISALAMGLMLAGCGGGSGGGVASASTPSSATYTKVADLSGDRTFQTAGVQYTVSSAGFVNGTPLPFGSGITVAYIAASDSYRLTAPDGGTVTFGPTDAVAPSPSMPNSQQWTKVTANTRDTFSLTVPSSVALSYTVVGSWARTDLATNQTEIRLGVGGVPTVASDMPRSGSATYTVGIGGSATQGAGAFVLGGNSSATFSADFANNSVATSLMLAGGASPMAPTVTPFGTFTGTGTISGSGPGFSGTLSGNGATGAFAGAFFGPRALEMGYDWFLSGGSFSAVGTVVGAKQ